MKRKNEGKKLGVVLFKEKKMKGISMNIVREENEEKEWIYIYEEINMGKKVKREILLFKIISK